MGVPITFSDGSTFEEDRIEITFINKRDGKTERDTLILYAPFVWMSDSRKLIREYDENGKCKRIYASPYQKFEVAGIHTYWFKEVDGLQDGPRDSLTSEEIELIRTKFGESPFRHLCYRENGKPACHKNRESEHETIDTIDDVTCSACLLVLAKRGLAHSESTTES